MSPGDERGDATRIFLQARELSSSARESFLQEACAGDDELRRDVDSLLAHDETIIEDSSSGGHGREAPEIPDCKIIRRIGEGGMGEVWLAWQERPVQREVAVKVIKAGMDTKHVIARFEAERQALALMEHPGIAKVFDAGETPRGLPYFIMEYVKGESITAYADRHHLGIGDRLALFVQVCQAVQHAHQKGVIHRDLKPSNILVTVHGERPTPIVIDFGLAKATAQPLTERSLFTALGTMVGTPEYMSPEQAESTGLDVDTRTDIYSLGVVLYELLVGVLPLDSWALRAAGYDEIRRRIREDEPPTPSSRLQELGASSVETAQRRQTEPGVLRRQVRGDLDWITMRALEKDRTRRYQSVSELVAEVERHQRSEPVLAGPPSARYKLTKFVRRHRVGVTATLLVALALVGGIVASTIGFVRAQRAEERALEEAATANQVTSFLEGLFETSDPFKTDKNTITMRTVLDRGAERVRRELRERPRVQGRLLGTIGSVYVSLGEPRPAFPLLEEAVRIARRTAGSDDPETAVALIRLAKAYIDVGDRRKVVLSRRAVAIDERALGPNHVQTGRALGVLAAALLEDPQEEATRNRAIGILEANLGPDHVELTETLVWHAFFLRRERRYAEAEQVAERILAIQERAFGVGHPNTLFPLNTLGNICFMKRDYAKAEEMHSRCFELFQKMYDRPPGNSTYLAEAKMALGKFDEAIRLLVAAETYWARQRTPEASNELDEIRARLMIGYMSAGRREDARAAFEALFHRRESDDAVGGYYSFPEAKYWALDGNRPRALACLRRAIASGFGQGEQIDWFRDRELASLQGDAEFESIVARASMIAAVIDAQRRSDFDSAEALFRRGLEADPRDAPALTHYALLLRDRRKDYGGAEALFRRAIEAAPSSSDAREGLAVLFDRTGGHDEEADALFRAAIEIEPAAPWRANYAHFLLGRGRAAEGLTLLDATLDSLSPDGDWVVQVECWFDAFCFRPEPGRAAALARLKEIIVAYAVRSENWEPSRVVAQATRDKHPDAVWLPKLADVINGKASADTLEAWPAWAAIELND